MHSIRGAVAAALAVLCVAAPAALAHEGNPNYSSEVSAIAPALPGLQARVLNHDDAIELVPAGEEGESVYFPTIQRCEKGQTRWIQIPAEGESAEELEEPAPAVVLTAAQGHGGAAASEEGSAAQPAASVQAASVSSDDDGAPMWLAVAALAVGALGLLAGVGGLMAGRRRSA